MTEEFDNQVATLQELARKAGMERRIAQPITAPLSNRPIRHVPYTIAVTSGKGGVGKTVVTVNLALQFAKMGLKVLIIDADLGLANVDVMLGLRPRFTIQDVLEGRMSLDEVAISGPEGITILPAASGVADLSYLNDHQRIALLDHLDHWQVDFDVVLVDTGAGISPNVRYFVLAVEKILVIATPDPSSIRDAYSLIKVMFNSHHVDHFELLVNQVDPDNSEQDGRDVYRTIRGATDKFLHSVGLDYLGCIPRSEVLARAVRQNRVTKPENTPNNYTTIFSQLAERILSLWSSARTRNNRPMFFWQRVLDDSAHLAAEAEDRTP